MASHLTQLEIKPDIELIQLNVISGNSQWSQDSKKTRTLQFSDVFYEKNMVRSVYVAIKNPTQHEALSVEGRNIKINSFFFLT